MGESSTVSRESRLWESRLAMSLGGCQSSIANLLSLRHINMIYYIESQYMNPYARTLSP